jgi:hypothetical protein
MRLKLDDAPPKLADDLRWILDLCAGQKAPNGFGPISESDRRQLVEKLMHILLETTRMTA